MKAPTQIEVLKFVKKSNTYKSVGFFYHECSSGNWDVTPNWQSARDIKADFPKVKKEASQLASNKFLNESVVGDYRLVKR